MQPSLASWLTDIRKVITGSYKDIQGYLMQLNISGTETRKKIEAFQCLAKFATIVDKELSKQVHP